jgi:hypothetical protein
MILKPTDFLQIPFHDARLAGFAINFEQDGSLTASLSVRINPEESLEPCRKFGLNGDALTIVFVRCWQIKGDILGFASGIECIYTLDIVYESELIAELISKKLGNRNLVHFKIIGSTGSQIDVVASEVSISENPKN